MGLDQPDARRGGEENGENKGVFFFFFPTEQQRWEMSFWRGDGGFLSSSLSPPPLFLLLAFVPSVCKFTIYINSCLGTREDALSHIEQRRRGITVAEELR